MFGSPFIQMMVGAGVEVVAVFFAVIAALIVEERRERRVAKKRAIQISGALKSELDYYIGLTEQIAENIKAGLSGWERSSAAGSSPAPFFFRLEGAERPPQAAWQAAIRSKILDVFDPQLVFEIGNFYHEIDGVGQRYIRYDSFVEAEILPRLEAGNTAFYSGDSLLPQFRANMDRLGELGGYHEKFVSWAREISGRIEKEIHRLAN
ncbi:MAG: hypothetical protein ACYSUQ_10540 [Planctomycetota bacterium]